MNAFDEHILYALFSLRDPIFTKIFLFVTHFGDSIVIASGALLLGAFFLMRKQIALFAGLSITILGTASVVFSLKEIVARARPELMYQAYAETGFSLPSGHASLSLALYGFLTYFVWKEYPQQRVFFTTLLGTLIVLIGFSRLYLGVHFLSDVLVAYMIAGLFLALGAFATERFSPPLNQQR